jgi:hypothetical protein
MIQKSEEKVALILILTFMCFEKVGWLYRCMRRSWSRSRINIFPLSRRRIKMMRIRITQHWSIVQTMYGDFYRVSLCKASGHVPNLQLLSPSSSPRHRITFLTISTSATFRLHVGTRPTHNRGEVNLVLYYWTFNRYQA